MNAGGEKHQQWAQTAMFTASEVETQTGVPATTLRQWERRYGFPRPVRNDSGYRLYSPDDVRDIEIMLAHQRRGVGARVAADLTRQGMTASGAGGPAPVVPTPAARPPASLAGALALPELAQALTQALVAADYARAGDVLAGAHARLPVEAVMTHVMSPALVEIGAGWARGELTIAHERGASHFLRSRLSALMDIAGRDEESTGGGWGPLLVAACAPGEQHELGLMMLTLALRRRGLRVAYLGANVPLADLTIFAHERGAQAILLGVNGEWALGDWGGGAWEDGAWVPEAAPATADEAAPTVANMYPASTPVRTETNGLAWVSGDGGQPQASRVPQPEFQRPILQRLGLPVFLGGALMNARPALAADLGGIYAGPDAPAAATIISGVLGHALQDTTPTESPEQTESQHSGPQHKGE